MLLALLSSTAAPACIDAPLEEAAIEARVLVSWDPLACGAPHRIVVELEDEAGGSVAASAPCALGGLVLPAPRFGIYHGRAHAWTAGQPIRIGAPVRLHVDEPVVRWIIQTPA